MHISSTLPLAQVINDTLILHYCFLLGIDPKANNLPQIFFWLLMHNDVSLNLLNEKNTGAWKCVFNIIPFSHPGLKHSKNVTT
jgi:hypothetical protein